MRTNRFPMILGLAALLAFGGCSDEVVETGEPEITGEEARKALKDEIAKKMPAARQKLLDAANGAAAKVPSMLDRLGIADVEGIPEIPKLTGDKEKDKAAVIKALEELKAAWDANNSRHAALVKDKVSKATPELADIDKANLAFQKVSDHLYDLLDKINKGE